MGLVPLGRLAMSVVVAIMISPPEASAYAGGIYNRIYPNGLAFG